MSALETLLSKTPYADGTGRRRLIAGGIAILGLYYLKLIPEIQGLEDISVTKFVSSPGLVIGFLLVVYSIGNLIELFSETIWIRAVSGIYWQIPYTLMPGDSNGNKWRIIAIRTVLLLPHIFWNFLKGFTGRTDYKIFFNFDEEKLLKNHEPEVFDGFVHPLGNKFTLAAKVISDKFDDADQKWAKTLIARSKDVATLTTTIFLLIAVAIFTGKLQSDSSPYGNSVNEYNRSLDSLSLMAGNYYNLSQQQFNAAKLDTLFEERDLTIADSLIQRGQHGFIQNVIQKGEYPDTTLIKISAHFNLKFGKMSDQKKLLNQIYDQENSLLG